MSSSTGRTIPGPLVISRGNWRRRSGGDVTEFFLPRDFHEYCVGCMQCILKDEKRCPHYEKLRPLTEAMDAADVIILASPVYVYHVTGAMKTFLDHYGYRWLIHRPVASMFGKQGVCISTSACRFSRTTGPASPINANGSLTGRPAGWRRGSGGDSDM